MIPNVSHDRSCPRLGRGQRAHRSLMRSWSSMSVAPRRSSCSSVRSPSSTRCRACRSMSWRSGSTRVRTSLMRSRSTVSRSEVIRRAGERDPLLRFGGSSCLVPDQEGRPCRQARVDEELFEFLRRWPAALSVTSCALARSCSRSCSPRPACCIDESPPGRTHPSSPCACPWGPETGSTLVPASAASMPIIRGVATSASGMPADLGISAPKGCPVIPGGSARGVRCGASRGGGSSSCWAYSGDPTTRRGAVAVVVRPPGITGQPLTWAESSPSDIRPINNVGPPPDHERGGSHAGPEGRRPHCGTTKKVTGARASRLSGSVVPGGSAAPAFTGAAPQDRGSEERDGRRCWIPGPSLVLVLVGA